MIYMRGYMMILFFQTWPDFTTAPLGLLQWLCPSLFLPWTPWTLSCPPKRKESVRLLRHPPRPPSHRPLLHLRARSHNKNGGVAASATSGSIFLNIGRSFFCTE